MLISSFLFFYVHFISFFVCVCGNSSLQSLDLSENKIERLPPSFSTMVSLTNLDMSHNMIKSPVPSSLGLVPNLETLRLQGNQVPLSNYLFLLFLSSMSCASLPQTWILLQLLLRVWTSLLHRTPLYSCLVFFFHQDHGIAGNARLSPVSENAGCVEQFDLFTTRVRFTVKEAEHVGFEKK